MSSIAPRRVAHIQRDTDSAWTQRSHSEVSMQVFLLLPKRDHGRMHCINTIDYGYSLFRPSSVWQPPKSSGICYILLGFNQNAAGRFL